MVRLRCRRVQAWGSTWISPRSKPIESDPSPAKGYERGMRKDILERQAAAIRSHGLDAMISCSPENFAYVAGFVVPSQQLIRHRHAMVIVTASGTPAIFGVDMEATTIGRKAQHIPS